MDRKVRLARQVSLARLAKLVVYLVLWGLQAPLVLKVLPVVSAYRERPARLARPARLDRLDHPRLLAAYLAPQAQRVRKAPLRAQKASQAPRALLGRLDRQVSPVQLARLAP